MSPRKRKKPVDSAQATDTNDKRGACSACRTRKVRCDLAPGATACKRCIEGGLSEECIIQASRTRSRGNSAPPLDLGSQPQATGPRNRHNNHSIQQRSTSTTRGSSTDQSRPPPPPSIDSTRPTKRQRHRSFSHEPIYSTGSLTSVPEVDELESGTDQLEPLPLPLAEFYDHWAAGDNQMDDAGTDATDSDAKEFISMHHQDDEEPDASESDGEDRLKADSDAEDKSSDDGLVAQIRQQLPSAKPQAKRVPAKQKQPTKSTRKASKSTPVVFASLNDPATCVNYPPVFKIQCCVQQFQGSKLSSSPFQIKSSITLADLCDKVADKLNRHTHHVRLQYRLESDKGKPVFTSIQSDEELELFMDRMRPLIVPQLLSNGKISARPLKPILVIFDDSRNDESVESPARPSTGNSRKAGMKGSSKTPSNNELDGANKQQDWIEALHKRYQCDDHSKGDTLVYCYRAKDSTDCYALTHNHIAAWALQIMRKTATVDEKPLALLSLTKRSKKDEPEPAIGQTMQPVPMHAPAPVPYAYPPPPVIVVPPAAPAWGGHGPHGPHGYPGYPPLAPHPMAGHAAAHMSHPTTPSLLTVELPNANPTETVPFPDIIRWFSFLDQRVRNDPRVNVTVDFTTFGPILQAKGFLDISQLSRDYVSVADLQAWLGVQVGTAIVIRSHVDTDIQAINAGKHVLPRTDN
ncbi:hypothetical protein EV363DRAFT_1293320 [Boletus edulis]|nr:hypothetical protein EV363DRAFT_1293320 [Boletus edulis]